MRPECSTYRDLSLFFWGRFLWLRRTLLSGEWPLWDPYIGGGQSAVADALHQMFLLPVLAIRLIGPEVVSFNLWVLLPFPVAAAGAWLFLARRFSVSAAALGAIAFAVSGPVVSTGNFPNMAWSVAAMPWVLWSTDRVIHQPAGRRAGEMALAVAFQALAGEPVTFFMTSVLAAAWAATGVTLGSDRLKATWWASAGFVLGVALSAIQLVPMVEAATLAERSQNILKDAWSLHPLALVETMAFQLFGNYYSTQSLSDAPWVVVVNVGREPFFFSLYYGVPLWHFRWSDCLRRRMSGGARSGLRRVQSASCWPSVFTRRHIPSYATICRCWAPFDFQSGTSLVCRWPLPWGQPPGSTRWPRPRKVSNSALSLGRDSTAWGLPQW